ncbi:MAG: TIR domain-containing protein [bacterium]
MSGLFISYSWKDEKSVARFCDDLLRHKVSFWIDRKKLEVGMSLPEVIQTAIRECEFFCLLVSPDALKSPWVQKEYRFACEQRKTILPCWIRSPDDVDSLTVAAHPFYGLHDIVYADFRHSYEQGINEFFGKLGIVYHPLYPDVEEFFNELKQKVSPAPWEIYSMLRDYFQEADRSRKADQYEQAIQKLEIIVRIKPELVSPKVALGICYALVEKHGEAAREFAEVTKYSPSDYRGWAGLGAAQYYLGDFAEAVAAFERALKIRKHADELRNNYGRALLGLRRSKEAAKAFRQAREQMPKDANVLAGLGTALLWNGQYHEAVSIFQEALRFSSAPLAEAVCGLGEALENLNRLEEAREIYRHSQSTGNPEIIRRLARSEWCLGNIDRSLQLYDDLCRDLKNRQVYLVEMAQLLSKLGRDNEMRRKCEESLKCQIVSASDFYYAGLACYLLGEKIAAACFYQTSTKMDREFAGFPYQKLN